MNLQHEIFLKSRVYCTSYALICSFGSVKMSRKTGIIFNNQMDDFRQSHLLSQLEFLKNSVTFCICYICVKVNCHQNPITCTFFWKGADFQIEIPQGIIIGIPVGKTDDFALIQLAKHHQLFWRATMPTKFYSSWQKANVIHLSCNRGKHRNRKS